MKRLSIVLSIAVSMWACDGGSRSSSPTSPSVPAGAGPSYTLSGVVFAKTPAGLASVAGAQVEERNLRQRATTDANGFYSISKLYVLSNSVTASKDGYDPDTRNVVISGDTRLDLQITQRLPYTLSGVVFEMTATGPARVEGVDIYCDACGQFGHTWLTTDGNGFYSFSGVYNGLTPLLVRKEGYVAGRRDATVSGDTRFDIQIVRQ